MSDDIDDRGYDPIQDNMLLSASKKTDYPVVELTTDTKGLNLLETYLVVYLIKEEEVLC